MSTDKQTTLPLDQLQPNPFQPREKIKTEEIADLVVSVKNYGIIEPILVAHTPAGYQIIAGERRWRAAKEAGLTEVPVMIRKTSPKEMLELALVENVQRQNLNPIERAKGFQRLIREFNFTASKISEKIGHSPAYISNSMRLLDLPDAIKDGLIGGQITEGHARALAGLDNERLMVNAYKQLIREGASVRRAEQLVRDLKNKENLTPREVKTAIVNTKPRIKELKKQTSRIFKNPADLKINRSNRQTRLIITIKGNQETTEADLEKLLELLRNKK